MQVKRLFAILAFLATPVLADFSGQVVGVIDGDTLDVLRDGAAVRIRVAEIDAPEKAQAFGQKSKESLSGLCFKQVATVRDTGKRHRDRVIAAVECQGLDAGREQIHRGLAWVYDRYATDRTLYAVQEEAKAAHRGLWSDPAPTAPWEWRKTR